MIRILTVNYNSYDFLHLLIDSVEYFEFGIPYEIVVIDNSTEKQKVDRKNTYICGLPGNEGHGAALDYGLKNTSFATPNDYEYTMVVDVDCHFLCFAWEDMLLDLMEDYDFVAGRGVPQKPIRPACMFMKNKIGVAYNWKDTPRYKGHRVTPEGFDTTIQAYHQMVRDGVPIWLLESQENRYQTLNGEEWCVDGRPFLYHHWHGTHLKERQVDFPNDDLMADKEMLFEKLKDRDTYWTEEEIEPTFPTTSS